LGIAASPEASANEEAAVDMAAPGTVGGGIGIAAAGVGFGAGDCDRADRLAHPDPSRLGAAGIERELRVRGLHSFDDLARAAYHCRASVAGREH
jgi:hypothetical protein